MTWVGLQCISSGIFCQVHMRCFNYFSVRVFFSANLIDEEGRSWMIKKRIQTDLPLKIIHVS